jgi:hypothetical protein
MSSSFNCFNNIDPLSWYGPFQTLGLHHSPTIILDNKHINHNFMRKHLTVVQNSRGKIYISTILICAISWIYIELDVLLTWPTIFLDMPIVCMIPTNNLQELSKYTLPCCHSLSSPMLGHPLLYYTVPRVIHLALPRISHTRRVFRDFIESYSQGVPLTFSTEASLWPVLPQHNIFQGDHDLPQGYHVTTIARFHAF